MRTGGGRTGPLTSEPWRMIGSLTPEHSMQAYRQGQEGQLGAHGYGGVASRYIQGMRYVAPCATFRCLHL